VHLGAEGAVQGHRRPEELAHEAASERELGAVGQIELDERVPADADLVVDGDAVERADLIVGDREAVTGPVVRLAGGEQGRVEAVVAALRVEVEALRLLRALRVDVDDAAERVRAVEGGPGAADDLDAV